jgi:hypothetical protein
MTKNELIDNLLNHCKNYASDLLMETGELFPFGALTDSKGLTHHREVEVDEKKIPSNGEIIESLLLYFTDAMKNHGALAYALCCEASVKLDENNVIDAISIDIRHAGLPDIPMFYYPFTLSSDDEVTFGEMFAVKR